LLRIINTYPWILNVAQNKFEPICARNVFIQSAVSEFFNLYSTVSNINFSQLGIFANPTNLFIFAIYDFIDYKNGMHEKKEIIMNPFQIASSTNLTAFSKSI
jgi:hypothetical protein